MRLKGELSLQAAATGMGKRGRGSEGETDKERKEGEKAGRTTHSRQILAQGGGGEKK